MTENLPVLGENSSDRMAALLRSVAGVIPWAGSAFAEIITQVIPNQRIERLEKYVILLAQGLESEGKDAQALLGNLRNIEFFEEGAVQASRALSNERLEYIAKIVAGGIAAQDIKKERERRILRILPEIDDEEIVLLLAYCEPGISDKFAELRPPPAHLGSSTEMVGDEALYKAGPDNLERLGLLEMHYPFIKTGQVPKFGRNGIEGGSRRITWLGRMLLKRIGLIRAEME